MHTCVCVFTGWVFFSLPSRMMGILLPAFHRQYSALKASGLNSTENDSDHKAVLQLVLRERGVAWADQHADRACEEPPSNQQELTSLLSFSRLVCRPSTPCSKWSLSASQAEHDSSFSFASFMLVALSFSMKLCDPLHKPPTRLNSVALRFSDKPRNVSWCELCSFFVHAIF